MFGVMQPRRRARLEPEPLDLDRVDPAVQRQDLQAPRAGPATPARPRRPPPCPRGRSRGGCDTRRAAPAAGTASAARPSNEAVWSPEPGLSPSITSRAGKNSRICSAHWGKRSAYSDGEGFSPRRRRSRNSSASRSAGRDRRRKSRVHGSPRQDPGSPCHACVNGTPSGFSQSESRRAPGLGRPFAAVQRSARRPSAPSERIGFNSRSH